jgi:hypothetical protein
MGQWSPWIVGEWMNQAESLGKWMGLCFSDPVAAADPLTVEIASLGYQREGTGWTRSAHNVLTLDVDVVIHGLAPGDVVAAVVGFDQQFNGRLIFSDLLDVPRHYPSGGTYVIPAGEYVLGIDVAGT